MDDIYIDEQFIRERITQLRLAKGVSEREMSLSIGMCESYIRNITSTRALPSMPSFLNICEYFKITPAEFFESDLKIPNISKEAMRELERLFGDDLAYVINFLKMMKKSHADTVIELLHMQSLK